MDVVTVDGAKAFEAVGDDAGLLFIGIAFGLPISLALWLALAGLLHLMGQV